MDKNTWEANRGVVVVDPETGQIRQAGNYSAAEWDKLSKYNPDLATAVIALRQAESDRINAEQNARLTSSLGLGSAASTGILLANRDRIHDGLVQAIADQHASWIPAETEIYKSPRVSLYAPPDASGTLELTVDGSLIPSSSNIPTRELVEAKRTFQNFVNTPEGRKLYVVTPSGDAQAIQRKANYFEKLGFRPDGDSNRLVLDARPGADQIGPVYRMGDQLVKYAINNPRTAFRLAGAALGTGLALGLGGIINTARNVINPLEDV